MTIPRSPRPRFGAFLGAPFATAWLLALAVLVPAAERSAAVEQEDAGVRALDGADLAAAAYELLDLECFECHGGRKTKAGLNLTAREGALEGGDRGAVNGLDADGTPLLLAMISYRDEEHQMPPSGVLPDADRALLARWIEAGLPYPAGTELSEPEEEGGGGPKVPGRGDGLEGWAYQPVTRPAIPRVSDERWQQHPVDALLFARLEAQGLHPVGVTTAAKFIRRATYDLTGLPPTPEQVSAFEMVWEADQEEAVTALIERLLASPQYGEKWARYWLDLVRYAETNGFERDSDKPHVWRYRDWVVAAFNRDLPYDRFARAQLAGDEIAARSFLEDGTPRPEVTDLSDGDVDQLGNLTATGFFRIVQWDDEPGQGRLQARYDTLADILATTSEAFLGTTMGCARCHDHPADPFLQEEYYSLMAYLHGVTNMSGDGYVVQVQTPETQALREQTQREREEQAAELRAGVSAKTAELRALESAQSGDVARSASGLIGVRWRLYRDTFEALPDFEQVRHEEEGTLEGDLFSLAPRSRDEAIGFVQAATLDAPAGERRAFRMSGGDAARLLVDGTEVLGYTNAATGADGVVGEVDLAPGPHELRVEWIQRVGEPRLVLDWRPQPVPLWSFTTDDPGAGWHEPGFDASAWSTGPGGFGSAGTPGARIETAWNGRDLWLRRTFVWGGDEPADCVLVAHHDEDAEVWLNGAAAWEQDGYRRDYGVFGVTPAARATLVVGANHMAAHVRNTGGGQYIDVVPAARGELIGRTLEDFLDGWRPLSADALGRPEDTEALRAAAEDDQRVVELRKELQDIQRELERLRNAPLPGTAVAAVQEAGVQPEPLSVHVRGNAAVPGMPVEPGIPAVLGGAGAMEIAPLGVETKSSGRRLALARWMTGAENPLFARVMVNRLWLHHFGRGLCASPSDFGELGERPTHPELLDFLAAEFVARDWSLKAMHRLLMTSQAYRMSSTAVEQALAADPTNRWFWRFPLRRLTAEELRDSMLAVSGELNLALGGKSFFEPVPRDVLATSSRPDNVWGHSSEEDVRRRSIYIKVKRSLRPPMLVAFDAADTDAPCAARFETVQPAQALTMLNSAFSRLRAAGLAARTLREAGDDDHARALLARRLAFSREPLPDEVADDLDYLRELREEEGLSPEQAWEDLCLLLYNLSEFAYLD